MNKSNLFTEVWRIIGWAIVRGLKWLSDLCQMVFNRSFNLLNWTDYSKIDALIKSFRPLLIGIFILSLMVLGFILIVDHKKKPKILNTVIIMLLVFSATGLIMNRLNAVITYAKDAILTDEENTYSSTNIIRSNLYDLLYIDKQLPGGISDMEFNKNEDTNYEAYLYPELSDDDLVYIDFIESIDPNSDYLKDNSKEIMSKKLVWHYSGSALDEINSGYKLFNNFGNEWYYRYKLNWFPTVISMIALILVYLIMSYKTVRIIFEIVVHEILAFLYSSNINEGKKTLKIIEGIKNSYIALLLCCVLIKLFLFFQEFISSQMEMNAAVRSLLLLFAAFAVIDGPNIIQQITGIDAGLTSGFQKLMSAGRMVQGTVRGATMMYDRHERRQWQKSQTEQMKNNKNGNSSSPGSIETPHNGKFEQNRNPDQSKNMKDFASDTKPDDIKTNDKAALEKESTIGHETSDAKQNQIDQSAKDNPIHGLSDINEKDKTGKEKRTPSAQLSDGKFRDKSDINGDNNDQISASASDHTIQNPSDNPLIRNSLDKGSSLEEKSNNMKNQTRADGEKFSPNTDYTSPKTSYNGSLQSIEKSPVPTEQVSQKKSEHLSENRSPFTSSKKRKDKL